jgi:3-oxo-5alpha-steroid 4-dehydrogenase
MFTGNEKVWPFREQAKPAPRGHMVPAPGDTGGREARAGVEVRYETSEVSLVTDESGAVIGLATRSFSDTGVVRAGATVIAAGGSR